MAATTYPTDLEELAARPSLRTANVPAVPPYRPNFTMPGEAPPSQVPAQSSGRQLATRAGNALKSAGPQVLDAAAAGIGGAAAAAGVNSLRQGALNTAPVLQATPEAPGQIPGADPRYQAPRAAAGSFLNQTEAGRNIGNIVNAVPAFRAPVGAFTRAAAATNTLRFAGPAATAVAAGRGYVAGDAAFPGMAPERAAPATAPTSTASDYSNEGRNYPTPVAPDLTGKILRDGNTYSGKDIKFGADIVNARNPGVGVSSLDTSEGFRQNLLELERNAAERARAPVGGVGGFNTTDPIDTLRAKAAPAPATRTERMAQAALASREGIAAAQTGASLRGQELGADTTRRGQDLAAETARGNTRATLRGQDLDYAGRLDVKKMDLAAREAQRRAVAAAWNGTTDPQVAAARLAAAGYDPTSALSVAGGQRAGVEASRTAVDDIVAGAAAGQKKDGTGYIDPAKAATVKAVLTNAAPGVGTASPTEIASQAPRLRAITNLASGLQEAQGGSLLETLGIANPPSGIDSLPNLQGASLRTRGYGSPFANASKGDYELVQPDGTVDPIKRSRISQKELDYLKQQGVSLRELN